MLNLDSLCKVALVITSLVLVIEAQPPAPNWNYHEIKGWKEHYSACGGAHQSPIGLKSGDAQKVPYSKFTFGKYDKLYPELVTNNGHTAQFNLENIPVQNLPFITDGGLEGRYIFEQMHFHWGKSSAKGSEHHIDGRAYPAELHMVHYNSKYANFTDAVPHADGLAVLGILIQSGQSDNIAFRHLEQFEGIKSPSGKTNSISYPVPLSDLLPPNTDSFFRYNASLTTPGCNENVTWTVFDTPISISESQLKKFRQLRDHEGKPLENNFRPVQELHDRVVTYRSRDTVPPVVEPEGTGLPETTDPSIVLNDPTLDIDPNPVLSDPPIPSFSSVVISDGSPLNNPLFRQFLLPYFAPPDAITFSYSDPELSFIGNGVIYQGR